MDLLKTFDSYDLKARVYPALLTMLPAVATLLAWHPSLLTSNAGAAVLTVINTCGLLFLFAELSRSQGQRAQRRLLKTWKVLPAARILRHGDIVLPAEVKARYHRHLAAQLGSALPTAAEETANPDDADTRYAAAVLWLIEQCRGPAHFLLLNENTSYGFRRNLYGLKPFGVAVCIVALIGPALVLWSRYLPGESQMIASMVAAVTTLKPVTVAALGLATIGLVGWLSVVRAAWVQEAGELYGRRLLASCDTPGSELPGKVQRRRSAPSR